MSIFTNYECVRQYETYDKYTTICVELETERGKLVVYGTIMGIFGNREKSIKADIEKQIEDIRNLATDGANVCVIGDYNLSFCDNYYNAKYGRDLVNKTFRESGMDKPKEKLKYEGLNYYSAEHDEIQMPASIRWACHIYHIRGTEGTCI